MKINPNIPLVDSNIFTDYFSYGEKFNLAKEVLFNNGAFFNNAILTETTNILQNQYFAKKASTAVIKFFEFEFFIMLDNPSCLQKKALLIMQEYIDNSLSFTDCFILAQAEEYGLKVYTKDKKMQTYRKVEVIIPYE